MNFKRFHESKNLFDADTIYSEYKQPDGTYQATRAQFHIKRPQPFTTEDIGKAFTYSLMLSPNTNNVRVCANVNGVDVNGTTSSGGFSKVTFTVGSINDSIYFEYGSGGDVVTTFSNIMLNEGSQPLPYEPYSSEVWHDIPHYIMGTSTDTLTTLPAVLYPNDTTATVGLKGQMQQTVTPSPTTPIQPSECGDKTGNLFDGRFQQGFYAYNGGNYHSSTAYVCTYKTPCKSNTMYTFKCLKLYGAKNYGFVFFNSNLGYAGEYHVEPQSSTDEISLTATTPQNCAFLAVNVSRGVDEQETSPSRISKFMLNEGSTALPYEPHGQYKIPISSANTTTTVYLGEVQSTRKIKKYEFTGNELFYGRSGSPSSIFFVAKSDISMDAIAGYGICNNYAYSTGGSFDNLNNNEFIISATNIGFRNTSYTTVPDFKAYLQQQYAAGTPVTVWYVLANETTGIVNEPIRKIGDYADEVSDITIPTIAGADSFDVLTTLKPSEVTVNYKGWHPVSAVHERENGAWT